MSETTTGTIITSIPTQAELMSSPLSSEIANLPTTTIPMPTKGLGIKGELSPFCQRVLRDGKGEEITTNVFVAIANADADETVMLFGDENKKWLGVVDDQGTVLKGQRVPEDWGQVSVSLPGTEDKCAVVLSKTNDVQDGFSWAFRVARHKRDSRPHPHVTLAENATCIENPVSKLIRNGKIEHRKNIAKKLSGAVAIIATLSPGGLIDKAMDPVVDTASVVHDAASSIHRHIYTVDDHIDGMDLKDYPDILAGFNKESEAKNAEIDKVADIAVQTMLDLDAHDYASIQKRADEYVQRNPENFIDDEAIMAMKEQIAAATTNDTVLAALKPFQDFYSKQVTINSSSGEIPVASSKAIGVAILNEIGRYPKSLVEKAELDTIVIQRLNTDENSEGITAGDYNSYERRIRINAFSDTAMAIGAADSFLPIWNELSGARTYEATIAHEFGHALEGEQYDRTTLGDPFTNWGRDIVGALANYPEVISAYSRSNIVEKTAEDISGVLSNRGDGLTHPDDSRRFVSPANKALLAHLISFAVAKEGEPSIDPGIIDYLVARNPRLMGRSFAGLGH